MNKAIQISTVVTSSDEIVVTKLYEDGQVTVTKMSIEALTLYVEQNIGRKR